MEARAHRGEEGPLLEGEAVVGITQTGSRSPREIKGNVSKDREKLKAFSSHTRGLMKQEST